MGYAYATAAVSAEPDKVPLSARVTLVAMGLIVADKSTPTTPAGVFYGGHLRIAATLGRYPSPVVLRGIRRDIATLVALGLIERIGTGGNGRTAAYRLILTPVHNLPKPVDN